MEEGGNASPRPKQANIISEWHAFMNMQPVHSTGGAANETHCSCGHSENIALAYHKSIVREQPTRIEF